VSPGDPRKFRAVIEGAGGGGGGALVSVPFDVEEAYGKKRVKVKVMIDGEPYRGSVVRMGGPRHMLPVLKHIRQKIGKGVGEWVSIVLWEDLELRVVAVPADLGAALAERPAERLFFRGLSYTGQREYVRWIEDAKREETRARRISLAIRLLRQRKRQP
jgi:Domain of unknown function (DUF1905)/Bacteriocin-protection, YdeI or OmpD-Associated